ncbi:MAG: DEAD/DEAH box helicase [Thermoleophilia bacterium]
MDRERNASTTDRSLRQLFRPGSYEQVVAVAHEAARAGRTTPLPDAVPSMLRDALLRVGVTFLHAHQAAAYDALHRGEHVVISTGTASGKSLCYQLAILERQITDDRSRALLIFPTKALAQDQARRLSAQQVGSTRAAIYDGDTPSEARALARRTASILLTNPDMLHAGILPNHERWGEFLHHLDYVVLDEAHVYRGVFGSHVAQVIRRLRRLCALYECAPQFIVTSATVARPAHFAERLVGQQFAVIDEDAAPRPERTIVFWNPPLLEPARGERASALSEAALVTAECIAAGARVITFAPTRKAAELVHGHVRRRLLDRHPEAADRVQPYRSGYTPRQRREIERQLFDEELDAVVATQALELGIDIGALDVAVVTGFPGTITSLRQRWGRAGRREHGWGVLVGGQDALDQYFMREPERLLSRRVEEAVIDLHNPHISTAHLEAAAYELPLTSSDRAFYGELGMLTADRLALSGRLRRQGDKLVWAQPHAPAPAIGLRTTSTSQYLIVESRQGEVIGQVEQERVLRTAHPGAVYLHMGQSYRVERLDLETRTVVVTPFNGAYYTQVKTDKNIAIAGQADSRPLCGALLAHGEVEVTEQVISYQRRDSADQRIIDTTTLDLPPQTFRTEAFWLEFSESALTAAIGPCIELNDMALPGSLHAAEHALIAMLPLYAMCDRWDVGGLSTPWHWHTDAATIFVYDGYPGGIGLSRRGYEAFEDLAADAMRLIRDCPCDAGCPSCIQSPKCGNLNEPLHKRGAELLVSRLIERTPGN